jgi:DNA polymerase elongation subunit (family B)
LEVDYTKCTIDELKLLLDQAEKDASKYHNLQLAKKIQLNSAYGALGNEYFRWFNFNHAEAITTSGQLSIRWVEKKVNLYLNKILSTKNIDYVIASDTDSIYVNMEPLVSQLKITDETMITQVIDEFCEKKINPVIQKACLELSSMMNVFQPKLKMKRETIANKGIWKAKKMYILNAWNVEGVQFASPKLKIQGIEAVRSSTPHSCRENIKEALKLIMNKNEEDLIKFVSNFHDKFMELPFEDIAFPRGVNGMEKYADKKTIYTKGTPIAVKGSLLFNDLIKKHGLKNVSPIVDGDKIKFAYLKLPNIIQDTVIAVPDDLPTEFELDKYIDRELQFTKAFLMPLKSITEVIGWNTEHVSNLESFFS